MITHFNSTFPVYVQTNEPDDFNEISVSFLKNDFTVTEENFKTLSPGSIVILDDFTFKTNNPKLAKTQFLSVLNYILRHNKITLILIIHNLFGNFLFNDILYAPHIFLAYTNIGYLIMSKIYSRLGGLDVLNFYQTIPKGNFNFCYINNKRNYVINKVDSFFTRSSEIITMFASKQEYVIHLSTDTCGTSSLEDNNIMSQNIKSEIENILRTMYPKQKCLTILSNILLKHNAINDELCFNDKANIHILDFIRFINNTFDKHIKPDSNMLHLCKQLQKQNIKFPLACIKNPMARKYLT